MMVAMSVEAEVRSQPDCWAHAVELAPSHAGLLPLPGERVAVLGCGTSLYVARAYAHLREVAGLGITDAWPGGEARLDRGYDRVLVICRSGTTTDVLTTLDAYQADGDAAPVTIITATPDTPVHTRGDVITLAEFDETAVVQTRFATSTLALLRAHLGEDLSGVIDEAREILALPAEADLTDIRLASQFSFVGMGLGAALAEEAALKLRESTRTWAEAYHATEWRHGPASIAEAGRVVWAFGPLVPDLARDVAATGAHLEHHDVDPMAELVRLHRFCLLRAADLGIDASRPRNLTRSVILD